MGLDAKWNITVGSLPKGPRNLITDVPGVAVGHCTVTGGTAQTGVTAILPHGGDLFHDKVMAGCQVLNGFGKTTGLVQLEELGTIETPILLTNTLSVGTASEALVRYMLAHNPDIGRSTGTVNPLVCECNDGGINDIRALHITEAHVQAALDACSPDFAEGAVGAGRGMRCHGCKGGIGSASRRMPLDGKTYTLGVLALCNHGRWADLTISGYPVGAQSATPGAEQVDKGSVILILATDLPLSERQLKRVCRRAAVGLARVGSYLGNGSGDIAIAFTTANRVPHYSENAVLPCGMLHDDQIDTVFRAAAEAVEESVLSALLHAEAMPDRTGKTVYALADILARDPARWLR